MTDLGMSYPTESLDLFIKPLHTPLAERLRPQTLEDFIGQEHILAAGQALHVAITQKKLFSCLLWGPPGSGKTTLAYIIARQSKAEWIALSAVFSGVRDVRQAVDTARENRRLGRQTILFVDEIHRFNKSQQDAFLPVVEDGTIIFIGATTENPGFHINKALLSRLQVFELKRLSDENIFQKIAEGETVLASALFLNDEERRELAYQANGDARKALTWLEQIYLCLQNGMSSREAVKNTLQNQPKTLDKNGDSFYEQLSAFHKSLRGSSPDGAMYWFARMIDGGVDPLIIARRMLCVASEDIGNADPRALTIALNAYQSFERLGAPEGYLPLAQCLTYLALAPKSNASYTAMQRAFACVREHPAYGVPLHLRNAPTDFHQQRHYGSQYRYAHDEPNAYAAGQNYLPEELQNVEFYHPNQRGFEIKLGEKLQRLKASDQAWQASDKEKNE